VDASSNDNGRAHWGVEPKLDLNTSDRSTERCERSRLASRFRQETALNLRGAMVPLTASSKVRTIQQADPLTSTKGAVWLSTIS
jgi:hypothetical protein